MNPYEVLVFGATTVTVVVGVVHYLRAGGAFADVGRQGMLWFEHSGDREIADRPSEDELDAPIPRRPLRGRSAWSATKP